MRQIFRNRKTSTARKVAGFGLLAAGLLAIVCQGQALAWTGQPLAYVTTGTKLTVIDTGDNAVVDAVPFPTVPGETTSVLTSVAVAPDGKRVYANLLTSEPGADLYLGVVDSTPATDKLVDLIHLGGSGLPFGLAVAPDGTRAYVTVNTIGTRFPPSFIVVVDTTSRQVVANVLVAYRANSIGPVAVAPDGKHVYATVSDGSVLVMDTTTYATTRISLGATSPDLGLLGIAVTPDGKSLYVSTYDFILLAGSVTVIDLSTSKVATTFPVAGRPGDLAITPDGTRAYVLSGSPGSPASVLVFDTATKNLVKTVPGVGLGPTSIAFTPDGTRAYVRSNDSAPPFTVTVYVIETGTNTVTATIPLTAPPGTFSGGGIAIVPAPQGIRFSDFRAKLDVDLDPYPTLDTFKLESSFTSSSTASDGIRPDVEPVTLQVGPFITTIPAGSFLKHPDGSYAYTGSIYYALGKVELAARIKPTGTLRYAFTAEAKGEYLGGIANPVQVSLGIGDDAGVTKVEAHFERERRASTH